MKAIKTNHMNLNDEQNNIKITSPGTQGYSLPLFTQRYIFFIIKPNKPFCPKTGIMALEVVINPKLFELFKIF
jgi:hypothetical protein